MSLEGFGLLSQCATAPCYACAVANARKKEQRDLVATGNSATNAVRLKRELLCGVQSVLKMAVFSCPGR